MLELINKSYSIALTTIIDLYNFIKNIRIMKKKQPKKLQFSKSLITKINSSVFLKIKGGTDTVSVPVPMTQDPDKNSICYAIE